MGKMKHKRHAGLTLLIFSVLMLPFGRSMDAVLVVSLAAVLSSVPDFDINWEIKHRGYTHNVLAALVVGTLFGLLLAYASSDIWWWLLGFTSGFGGVICHLLGDALTHMKFKPLWPFSNIEVGLGWFSSGDKRVNNGFMTIGSLAFILYILVTTGAL